MAYTHFAKQADVWKHLCLCQILQYEAPRIYIESNSACAEYKLKRTPAQQYGIYHFLNKAPQYELLKNSLYFIQENETVKNGSYLGSPGLVMKVIGESAQHFTFFDIEEEALRNINDFATRQGISNKVKIVHGDSISGVFDLLPDLTDTSFLHIDPYEIDKPGINGYTYLDVLIEAARTGHQCLLWYGYLTLDEKKRLNDYITDSLHKNNISNFTCAELTMKIIGKEKVLYNPGILGSGMLGVNLSKKSNDIIERYGKLLEVLYKGTACNSFPGDLYYEVIK